MSNPLEYALTIAANVVLPSAALLISVFLSTRLYRKEREDSAQARVEEREHAALARAEERAHAVAARKEERLEVRIEEMTSALTSVAHYDPTQQSPGPVQKELRRSSTLLGNVIFGVDKDRAKWISEITFQTERMLEMAGPYIEVVDPDDPQRDPDRDTCSPDHPEAKIDEQELRELRQWAELAMSFVTQWHRSGQTAGEGRDEAKRFFATIGRTPYLKSLRI